MKSLVSSVLLIFSLVFCVSCENRPIYKEVVIRNVEAVYWHVDTYYGFAVENADGSITMQTFGRYGGYGRPVSIIRDVHEEDKMWAEAEVLQDNYSLTVYGSFKNLEIHIRSIEDINGAGWDRGKRGGSGTTNRIR